MDNLPGIIESIEMSTFWCYKHNFVSISVDFI